MILFHYTILWHIFAFRKWNNILFLNKQKVIANKRQTLIINNNYKIIFFGMDENNDNEYNQFKISI